MREFFTLVWILGRIQVDVLGNCCFHSDTDRKGRDEDYSSSEEEKETAQEKKLRLAKQYLAQIETEGIHHRATVKK